MGRVALLLLGLVAGCRYGFSIIDGDGGSGDGRGDASRDGVGAGGMVVAEATIIDNGARVNCPKIASSGSSFGMIWWDDRLAPMQTWKLYFRVFSLDGTPLGPEIVFDAPGAGDNCLVGRDLIWTGTEYAVLYTQTGTPRPLVSLATIAADGTMTGGPYPITTGAMDQHFNAAAYLNQSIGVVYTQRINGTTDEVRHVITTLGGVVTYDVAVSGAVTGATHPTTSVATGGEAVVWVESSALHYSYVAPMPTNNVTVTADATIFNGTDPDTIQVGSKQLLFYEKSSVQEDDLLLVDPTTAVPSGSPLVVSQAGGSQLEKIGSSLAMLRGGARLELLDASGTPTGQMLGPPTGMNPSVPSVTAVSGGELAFAWQEYDPSVPWYRIRFARIAP